jgi:hypothetical protein
MRTQATFRRTSWLPGTVQLAAALGTGTLLGAVLGVRSWSLYLGLTLAALLAIGWAERLWARYRAPTPRRVRTKLKVIQGGKHGYDLADDDSTDSQRYLM